MEKVKKINHYKWYCHENSIDFEEDSSLLSYIEYIITKGNNKCKTMLFKLTAIDRSIEALDIIHEIFINLYRYPVDNWDYTPNIVAMSFSKYIRNFFFSKRFLEKSTLEYDSNEDTRLFSDLDITDKLFVENLILELNTNEKRLIYLHYYEGMSTRDIGVELNIPHTTVAHQLKKIIEKLKTRI